MDKLLTEPDILKKMNEAKKQTSVSRHTISSFGLQRAKTQMKMKFDYSMKNIDSNVEKEVGGMLKENDRNKVKKNITFLIDDDIKKQNENWKLRLRNKKTMKSKSNINSPYREREIKRVKTMTPMIREERPEVEFNDDTEINIGKFNRETSIIKEEPKEETKVETDEEFNKMLEEKMKVLDGLITLDDAVSEGSNQSESKIKISEIPTRYQEVCDSIEDKINKYMNEFNELFYKEIFQNFFLELKKLIDEKYDKYIEISTNYHSQIKENEFLIDPDSPSEYQEAIKQSIELLKEDQEHQIGIIEFQYNSLITQKISDFKLSSFKSNIGLQLIEEKLKLDIYQIINEAL